MDVGATHAATAIDKEQQFSGGSVQLQRFTHQVGAEVEHQDGAAQNVLVVSLPHKLQLWAKWNINISAWDTCEISKVNMVVNALQVTTNPPLRF